MEGTLSEECQGWGRNSYGALVAQDTSSLGKSKPGHSEDHMPSGPGASQPLTWRKGKRV